MRIAVPLLGACIGFAGVCPSLRADPDDAVVKVTAFLRPPNAVRPWDNGQPVQVTGSGAYIGENRIVTNAHVVAYGSEIYVQWSPTGEKGEAKIEALSADLDLAVLTVANAKFFDKREPLLRAKELPKVKDSVTVYGYPRGGDGLSITQGEVSRLNAVNWGAEGAGMQIQTTAAINPGNSGGPAIVGGKMIGVVYSILHDAQSIGYVIPAEEVDYFLSNIKNGRYAGKPRANELATQPIHNPAMRRMLKMQPADPGVLVLQPTSDGALRANDVLTKIGDFPINNAGLVLPSPNLSVAFSYMIPKLARGNSVPVSVRRDGKLLSVELTIQRENPFVIKNYDGDPLPYFIHGPLVLVPAKLSDINTTYAKALGGFFADSPLNARKNEFARLPGEELVVVSNQFRHKIADGYVSYTGKVVKSINGTPVKNLHHLVEIVRDSRDDFLRLTFPEGRLTVIMVLDRMEIEAATEQILDDNGIAPARRGSADMMAVWNAKKKKSL